MEKVEVLEHIYITDTAADLQHQQMTVGDQAQEDLAVTGTSQVVENKEIKQINAKLRQFGKQLRQCLSIQSESYELKARVDELERELDWMRNSVIYLEKQNSDLVQAAQKPRADYGKENAGRFRTRTTTQPSNNSRYNLRPSEQVQIRIVNRGDNDEPMDICQVVDVDEGSGSRFMEVNDSDDDLFVDGTLPGDDDDDSDYQSPGPIKELDKISKYFQYSKYPCHLCSKGFCSRADLTRHKCNEHIAGLNPLKCTLCGLLFVTEDELLSHTDKHEESYKQDKDKVLGKTSSIESRKMLTYCTICATQFKNKPEFYEHCKTSHPDNMDKGLGKSSVELRKKSIYCTICSTEFNNKCEFYEHCKTSHSDMVKPFVCKHCSTSFYVMERLAAHYTSQHATPDGLIPPSNTHPCTVCHKIFARVNDMKRHFLVHSRDIVAFDCQACGKKFTRKDSLTRHHTLSRCPVSPTAGPGTGAEDESTKTENPPVQNSFSCPDCDKTLTNRSLMQHHMKACHGDKNHKCDKCEKVFSSKSKLNSHCDNVHEKLKRFLCSACGQGFARSAAYKSHLETHQENRIKPHLCKICGRSFSKMHDVRRHEKGHAGIRDFKCQDCGMQFARQNSLNRHKRCHTESRGLTCEDCGASYSTVSALSFHKKMHNPNYVPVKKKRTKLKTTPKTESDSRIPVFVHVNDGSEEYQEFEVTEIVGFMPTGSGRV